MAVYNPLFRFLDEFDKYSSGAQTNSNHELDLDLFPRRTEHFQPKFDVRETQTAYELYGELAGLSRDNVTIEFTDTQSLVVRGHIDRTYKSTAANDEAGDKAEKADKAEEQGVSHKATVEDDVDDEGKSSKSSPKQASPRPLVKRHEKSAKPPTEKFWLTERSIGDFSRTFSFPTRVDQDAVTAQLNDGILFVSIPKMTKKPEARRIVIN
ncbi:HSP20-like chaperone [Podospora appendiculata]|uniref:HSP20-like chaperone n=1 Tax=Podospora appendiculata TaxID=314037 RepID=A0AAE0XL00_9PEZI|nr:HSP20-like chaperone [Podospora appendiculata]